MTRRAEQSRSAVVVACAALGAVAAAGAVGPSGDAATHTAAVLAAWVRSGWVVAVLMLAALGVGEVVSRGACTLLGSPRAERVTAASAGHQADLSDLGQRWALGVAIGLVVVIAAGWAGLVGTLWAWAVVGPLAILGGLTLAREVRPRQPASGAELDAQDCAPGLWMLALLPGLAVLVVAACSAPGWLFDSEFGGYDALSYHLQLPQEWHRLGRVVPVEHNVYSYLPGGVEALFALIAGLTAAPIDGALGHGLTAGTGWRLLACQQLHAGLAVFAAWQCGLLARSCGPRVSAVHGVVAWGVAGAVLATPWVVVTGALAYNEMAMLGLGAAGVRAAIGCDSLRRGVLCGVLAAGACAAKPTAILFVAPMMAIMMLVGPSDRGAHKSEGASGALPARLLVLMACGVAGAAFVGPWLARNWFFGGNPVFPQLSGLFGTAHWTPEQAVRYAAAHHGASAGLGGLLDAARLLVWADPAAGPASSDVERFRGLANPQWGLIVPAACAIGAAVIARCRGAARRMAIVMLGGLALQAIAWALLTHMQSRFLIPMLIPACGLLGLAGGALGRRAVPVTLALIVVVQGGFLARAWHGQRGGDPSARLLIGSELETGRLPTGPDGVGPSGLIPSAFLSELVANDPSARVALVGMATPLFIEQPVLWNTTWDAWPIADAARTHPDDPQRWLDVYRDRGVTHLVIAWGEVMRLSRSGYADPAVTPEVVRALAEACGEPLRVFDGAGVSVHRVPPRGSRRGNDEP